MKSNIAQVIRRQSELIFQKEMRAAAQELKQNLIPKVREKMREFEGKEKRNVRGRVIGNGFRLRVEIYGTLPQTFVDENGRKKGKPITKTIQRRSKTGKIFSQTVHTFDNMPPFGKGSALARWAKKKGFSNVYLLARKIARDGIKPGRPFARTKAENRKLAKRVLARAFARANSRLSNM